MRTYCITYHYTYTCARESNFETIKHETVNDFGTGKFICNKCDIKKEVEKHILEDEIPFADECTKIISLEITDCYTNKYGNN